MKKLISIFLMAMLLMTTVSFSTFAADEGEKTFIIYNSADGTATADTPVYSAADNGKYEDIMYYNDSYPTGRNSNKNEQNFGWIWTGKDAGRDYVSFMRFPLPDIPEQEIASSVKLSVTLSADVNIATLTELKVYGGFTDAAFGEAITYGKTFAELMALDRAGSVTLSAGSHAANTTLEIDITDYVKPLIQSDAESVDLALAMPDADVSIKLYNVTRKNLSTNAMSYKPHITVETEYSPDVYPTIDTVANEGKTKIQMQATEDDTFSNTSVAVFYGSGGTRTYNVNCETAGKYYLTVYNVNKFGDSDDCILTVNDGAPITKTLPSSNRVKDAVSNAEVRSRLKAHTFAINLVQGKNVIKLSPGSSNLGLCLVELTNYERAGIGEGYNITEKGIEVRAINQPIVTDYPTVVYKVYDTIAAAKAAGVTSANLTAQISNATSTRLDQKVSFIAATYNSQKQLENVEIVSYTEIAKLTQNTIDFGEFQIGDVEKIKFFVWTDGTLNPITASASIEE